MFMCFVIHLLKQVLRQEASEFQMEISGLKAELLNKSHKEKGNSLFGEVRCILNRFPRYMLLALALYEPYMDKHLILSGVYFT